MDNISRKGVIDLIDKAIKSLEYPCATSGVLIALKDMVQKMPKGESGYLRGYEHGKEIAWLALKNWCKLSKKKRLELFGTKQTKTMRKRFDPEKVVGKIHNHKTDRWFKEVWDEE